MTELYLDETLFEELRDILEDEFPVLISTYIQDSSVRVNELNAAMTRGDADAVRKAAHILKGSSANLGLVYLADLCRIVEDEARAGKAKQEEYMRQIEQQQEYCVGLLRARL